MTTRNKLTLAIMMSAGLTISPVAFSAGQGSLDSTSTGSSDIQITIDDSVKITDMDDITFPNYGGSDTGAINQGDAFCVYKNGGDGYNITATNPNGTEFALIGADDGDVLQYTLALSESDDASGASAVAYGAVTAFASGSVYVDCQDEGDGTNTAFDIRIAEQELRDSSTQTYTGTLQLLLQPI